MPWMIVSEDAPNSAATRADRAVMDAHWAYELSIRDRILARIDAQPDGVPMTKLLFNLPLPPGDGRYDELRAMLAEAEAAAEKAKSLLKIELDAIRNRHRDEHH